MRDFFSRFSAQMRDMWQGMNRWQRGLLVGVPVAAIILVVALITFLPSSYPTLWTNLPDTDRVDIERSLTTAGIPFESDQTSGTVSVDAEYLSRARMQLALEGLPHPTIEGYGIFDRLKLGATETEQRTALTRALIGEIIRAINSLETVTNTRVMLAVPEPSVFTERETPPKASVILTFRKGVRHDEDEIAGITVLVANAVEGLLPENVVVTDNTGRVVSASADPINEVTNARAALQKLEERAREQKIVEILMQTYGNKIGGLDPAAVDADGNALGDTITDVASVHVTADIDHNAMETETTLYDPETVVVKELIQSEKSEGVPIPSAVGVPGVTSNVLGSGSVSGGSEYTREESTTEYQAGVTRTLSKETPTLSSLSTAVNVNSAVLTTPPPPGSSADRALETEEMLQIRTLIAGAVGYLPGDPIIQEPVVQFMRFASAPGPVPPPPVVIGTWWRNPWIIAGILAATSLGLLGFLLLKPRFARTRVSEEADAEALPGVDEDELQALLARQRESLEDEEREQQRRRRQALVDLADANPEEIERVIRHWGEAN